MCTLISTLNSTPAARVVVSGLAMQLVILPHPHSLVPVGKVEDAVTILLVVLKVADVSEIIRIGVNCQQKYF